MKSPPFEEIFVFLKVEHISIVSIAHLIVTTPTTSEETLAMFADIPDVDLFWHIVDVTDLINLLIVFFYGVNKY